MLRLFCYAMLNFLDSLPTGVKILIKIYKFLESFFNLLKAELSSFNIFLCAETLSQLLKLNIFFVFINLLFSWKHKSFKFGCFFVLFLAECALLITIVANLFHSLERSSSKATVNQLQKLIMSSITRIVRCWCNNLFTKKDTFSRAFWIT